MFQLLNLVKKVCEIAARDLSKCDQFSKIAKHRRKYYAENVFLPMTDSIVIHSISKTLGLMRDICHDVTLEEAEFITDYMQLTVLVCRQPPSLLTESMLQPSTMRRASSRTTLSAQALSINAVYDKQKIVEP